MKNKQPDPDSEMIKRTIEQSLTQRYKIPFKDKLIEFIQGFLLILAGFILIVGGLYLIGLLIENPVSLAIICVTILGGIVWITK